MRFLCWKLFRFEAPIKLYLFQFCNFIFIELSECTRFVRDHNDELFFVNNSVLFSSVIFSFNRQINDQTEIAMFFSCCKFTGYKYWSIYKNWNVRSLLLDMNNNILMWGIIYQLDKIIVIRHVEWLKIARRKKPVHTECKPGRKVQMKLDVCT